MKQTLLTICLIVFALPSWGESFDDLVLRNTQIEDYKNALNLHLRQFWNPPIGAAGAENLIVDIFVELDSRGNVLIVKWVNRGMNGNNSFYIAAANAAIRAVQEAAPLPLPKEKYDEWRKMTLVFNPKIMFGGY